MVSSKAFAISIIIFLATIGVVAMTAFRGEPVVVKTNIENLPLEIAGIKGRESSLSDSVVKELNTDKYLYRHYRADNGNQVTLYIGYYGTKKGGRSTHNPYACLPGAGWGIVDSYGVRVRTKYYPDGAEVNYILAQKGDDYEIMLHWYQSAGTRVLATGIQRNIHRFIEKSLRNRNDGAFIQISTPAKEPNFEESKRSLIYFSEQLLNIMPEYWPVEGTE